MPNETSHSTLVPLALLRLSLAACSADPLNIVVLSARAPGDKCDFSDDTKYVEGGSVDFRPYVIGAHRSYVHRHVRSDLRPGRTTSSSIPLQVNGQTVDNGAGNDFIADSVVYKYQYSDPSRGPRDGAPEHPHAAIAAGACRTQHGRGET